MILIGDTVYVKPGTTVGKSTGYEVATSADCATPFVVESIFQCRSRPRAWLIACDCTVPSCREVYAYCDDLSKSRTFEAKNVKIKIDGVEVKGYENWNESGSGIKGSTPTEEMFDDAAQKLLAGTDFDPNF